MNGYKIVNQDLKGRGGFQFEIGKIYETTMPPKVHNRGFHFCRHLIDCFDHYDERGVKKIYLKIKALGEIDNNGTTEYATNKIQIVEEIDWQDVKEIMFKELWAR